MAQVIELAAFRRASEAPDPVHVRQDGEGRPLFEFALEYAMDGKSWAGITVWAYDWPDAEQRVTAIRESLALVGQLKSSGVI